MSNGATFLILFLIVGFSTFNDITYPLVTQTILTTGQLWSFCVYQLNTTLVHSENSVDNPKRNICWITEPIKLFDKVEDGIVHGFNEDVLKKLIVFYMNMPAERTNVNMKPYLGESTKHIADIVDSDRRTWLENHFKHLMSNRPRHLYVFISLDYLNSVTYKCRSIKLFTSLTL